MENQQKKVIYGILAAINLIGAVLLIATPFGAWVTGPSSNYHSINAGTIYGLLIIPGALLLFFCAAVFIIQFVAPEKLPEITKNLIISFSLTCFIVCILGTISFEILQVIDKPLMWWLGAGFYGCIISSSATTILVFIFQKKELWNI